jgi:hypothetical protein
MLRKFTHFADRVNAMLGEGATLAVIGEEVDSWPLPAEERSALWLLAWCNRPARSVNGALQRTSPRRNGRLHHAQRGGPRGRVRDLR